MITDLEREFFERLKLPLILCSYENGIIRTELVSDGVCDVANSPREELLKHYNNNFFASVDPEDLTWVQKAGAKFLQEHSSFDCIYRYNRVETGDNIRLHAIARWQPMSDGSEMILIGYNNMRSTESGGSQLFTASEAVEDEILFRDKISGLHNFNYQVQFADESVNMLRICNNQPVLIYMDVIGMHSYNSSYGYEKGDDLIRLIARKIEQVFPDGYAGRGVDDHFSVICAFTSEDDIREKINELNRLIKQESFGNAEGIRAGVYVIDKDTSFVKAYDYSRQALKDIGLNRSVSCNFYSKELDANYRHEHYIIESFETAMEKNWIKVYYQPVIRMSSQKITAVEALARWDDPVKGMISPGEFIPVLSSHHLLYKLDGYMIQQVCAEFAKKKEAGFPIVPVSVNFSAQDFDHTDVALVLETTIKKFGVDPEHIIVEVTEQDIAKGTGHFKSQLEKIRSNGHRIWIDDFGSGYSSLNVFAQYDIDRIKFDMGLLHHLDDNNGANRKIMAALTHACIEMGVHTLAEGVETDEQLLFLKNIGCEMAQGYYFFKPEPLDTAIDRFEERGEYFPHETLEEAKASEFEPDQE